MADLERQGWVKRLETLVEQDETFAAAVAADHGRYAAARWALLSEAQLEAIEALGWTAALRDVGVGGVADASRIKCLHAHVAHALADRAAGAERVNVVGAWALERTDKA